MVDLDFAVKQDVGITSSQVQADAAKVGKMETRAGLKLHVAIVADGESSSGQDAMAATIVVSAVRDYLKNSNEKDVGKLLAEAMNKANSALCASNEQAGRLGGRWASVTLVAIAGRSLFLAHAGNSRAYLLRRNKVFQLTRDHLVGQRQPAAASLALGLDSSFHADIGIDPTSGIVAGRASQALVLKPNDRVVLCTDGLVRPRPDGQGSYVDPESEMLPILLDSHTPALEAARTLVSLAVGRGVDDNVTVVVIGVRPVSQGWVRLVSVPLVLGMLFAFSRLTIGPDPPMPTVTPTVEPSVTPLPAPSATPLPADNGEAIMQVQGDVHVVPPGQEEQPARPADALKAGTRLRTGSDGQAYLFFRTGNVKLAAQATTVLKVVQINRADDPQHLVIRLEGGDILVVVGSPAQRVTISVNEFEDFEVDGDNGVLLVNSSHGGTCVAGQCRRNGTRLVPTELTDLDRDTWNDLCEGCLSSVVTDHQ